MKTQVKYINFKFPKNIVGVIVSSIDGIPLGVISKNMTYGETRHMFVTDAKNTTTVKRIESSIKQIFIAQKNGPHDPKQCEFYITDSMNNVASTSWDPNFTTETHSKNISVACVSGEPQVKHVRITYVTKGDMVTDVHFRLLKVDYKCNDGMYSEYTNVIMFVMLIMFIAIFVSSMRNQNKKHRAELGVAATIKANILSAQNVIAAF
jgi:hypothetical protein